MLIKISKSERANRMWKIDISCMRSKAFLILSLSYVGSLKKAFLPTVLSNLQIFDILMLIAFKLYPITFALGRSYECELQKAH